MQEGKNINKAKNLPHSLRNFNSEEVNIKQRAKFIFYVSVLLMAMMLFFICTEILSHPFKEILITPHILLLPFLMFLLMMASSVWLLKRRYYYTIANLVPVLVMITTWLIIFLEKKTVIMSLDKIVIIIAVLCIVPMMVVKKKYIILLYPALNVLILFFYVFFKFPSFRSANYEIVNFTLLVAASVIFVGIVGYKIFSDYQNTLETSLNDLNKRREAEHALQKSEQRYKDLSDLLPQMIFESDLSGRLTYMNKVGLALLGYTEEEMTVGFQLSSLVKEKETLKENLKKILNGLRSGNKYTSVKKNGETFPVQVYSCPIFENENPVGFRGIAIDISASKQAEDALRNSERKYREMLMLLPQTVYEADLTGKLLYLNKAGYETFGFNIEDIHNGLTVYDAICKEDHERLIENIKLIINGQPTYGNRYMAAHKTGRTFPVQVHSNLIWEGERHVGFRGVIFDLTEIERVQNELKKTSDMFRILVENAPISMSLTDMQGRFILANNLFYKDLDLTPDMVIGKTGIEIGLNTNSERERFINEQLLSRGQIKNFEILSVFRDKIHTLYVSAAVIEINNEKVVVRFNVNVTDKKRLETKLKESENLFRLMVDMIPYYITIEDQQNQITFANKAFLKDHNFNLNDIKGLSLQDIGFESSREIIQKLIHDFKQNGEVINQVLPLTDPQGNQMYTLFSRKPVTVDQQPHYITSIIDITDRKVLEDQLKKYNEELARTVKEKTDELQQTMDELRSSNEEMLTTNEELYLQREELQTTLEKLKATQDQLIQTEKMASLGILTAGVAHEINNPINYIYNGSMAIENYIADNFPDHMENLRTLFDAVHTGINRTINIISTLNRYSRKDGTVFMNCNLHEIIENCLTMLYNQIKSRIEIIRDYDKTIPEIKAAEGKLHQVFLNLLTNAIQAIPETGKISVISKKDGDKAYIRIVDTGIGIDQENMKHIFDPFFTTKDPGKGTGLGLSIVQSIIAEHNGSIQCKSKMGRGTEFFIILPINS